MSASQPTMGEMFILQNKAYAGFSSRFRDAHTERVLERLLLRSRPLSRSAGNTKLEQFKTPGGQKHVITETYVARGRIVLWKLGHSPEFSRRRSTRGGLEQQLGTKLKPGVARNSTREHRNPTGYTRHATCRHRDTTN